MSDVIEQITHFSYSPIPVGDFNREIWAVRVEYTGFDRWAIRNGGSCYSRDGAWVYEPIPSSRTDEFLDGHRFTLTEAQATARRICGGITWNGRTADEIAGRTPR